MGKCLCRLHIYRYTCTCTCSCNTSNWQTLFAWLWRWLPLRLLKHQSSTAVLIRTTVPSPGQSHKKNPTSHMLPSLRTTSWLWRWINQHDTSVGQRKILSLRQELNHDLLNTGRVLYPLSYENSWRAMSFNWVHIWHVSCILLGSTVSKSCIMSSETCKLIKMVNFKLGNEMWRWINQHDTSMGQRKILSPWQESNPWPDYAIGW